MTQRSDIALCIMSNDADRALAAIGSAEGVFAEVCVLDTGMADASALRRVATRQKKVEWPGSFAAARNASARMARSPFVFVLDDDEEIENPGAVLALSLHTGISAATAQIENRLPAGDRLLQRAERIFARDLASMWQGRVHHYLPLAAYQQETATRTLDTDIHVVHHGYNLPAGQLAAKYTPRLHLFDYEIEHAKNDKMRAYYRYKKGQMMMLCEQYEAAMEPLALALPHLATRGRLLTLAMLDDITCKLSPLPQDETTHHTPQEV